MEEPWEVRSNKGADDIPDQFLEVLRELVYYGGLTPEFIKPFGKSHHEYQAKTKITILDLPRLDDTKGAKSPRFVVHRNKDQKTYYVYYFLSKHSVRTNKQAQAQYEKVLELNKDNTKVVVGTSC